MKSEGRGDVNCHPEIPAISWDRISEFLVVCLEIMEIEETGEKGSPEYYKLVEKLPKEYHNKIYHLIQMGAIFILMSFTARRGREKIHDLEWSHFKKLYHEELNIHYYAQIIKLSKKNRKKDKQRLNKDEGRGGVIPFEYDDYNVNPGRYIELFSLRRNLENPKFFQHPKLPKGKFLFCFISPLSVAFWSFDTKILD